MVQQESLEEQWVGVGSDGGMQDGHLQREELRQCSVVPK
jgi:hypothetical protein